jgi:hypothetical protein
LKAQIALPPSVIRNWAKLHSDLKYFGNKPPIKDKLKR